MPTIDDAEFGEIVVRRQAMATRASLRIAPDGRLRISLPRSAPIFTAKALVSSSRKQIRKLLDEHQAQFSYDTDRPIGKSHHLHIETGDTSDVKIAGTHIIVQIPASKDIRENKIQQMIRAKVLVALRKEAKSYLPRRLKFLAEKYDFSYDKVKLTHASSRWGSCSSNGTISLNIALMNLPFELLDYLLVHELSHTMHMDHSTEFWREVEAIDNQYKQHRSALKKYTPHI